jgi:hypothetical protein
MAARRALLLGAFVALVAACGNGGADQIHDLSTLPDHISVCGRTWVKDTVGRQSSSDEIRALAGVEPTVVGTGMFAACPAGVCTTIAQSSPCHTVVYVRVGEDAYIDYELSGGP